MTTEEFFDRESQLWNDISRRIAPLELQFRQVDLRFSASKAARSLGLSGPSHLSRWLSDRALPRYTTLRDWYYIDRLYALAEECGSLNRSAELRGVYPSVYSRFVRRVCGESWRTLQPRGRLHVRRRALAIWVAEQPQLLGFDPKLWTPE